MSIKEDITGAIEDAMSDSEYIKSELKKAANNFVDYMSRISDLAIDAFYADYPTGGGEPPFYDRYFDLYNLAIPLYHKIKVNGCESVTITIGYNAGQLPSHNNQDIIFSGPFEQGYHGGPRGGRKKGGSPAPKMSPSPYELIEQYFDEYVI